MSTPLVTSKPHPQGNERPSADMDECLETLYAILKAMPSSFDDRATVQLSGFWINSFMKAYEERVKE